MVYGNTANALKNANDYAGQVEKIISIFTKEGSKNLVISISRKMLYLGLASFGLAYLGIRYAICRVWEGKYFPSFVLLSTLAAVMVSAIYTIHAERADTFAYGRYHEYVMPVLMMMGVKELCKRAVCGIGIILCLEAVMTWMVTVSLREN